LVLRFSQLLIIAICFGGFFPSGQSPAPQEQTEAKRKVVTKVVPIYPELARKVHIMGSVRIEVIVSPDGSSKTIRVIGGHPRLAQAATDAIHKWRWVPAGQETTEVIEIKFNPE
jgi:TonB family protein